MNRGECKTHKLCSGPRKLRLIGATGNSILEHLNVCPHVPVYSMTMLVHAYVHASAFVNEPAHVYMRANKCTVRLCRCVHVHAHSPCHPGGPAQRAASP